jgi:hypothetical protein
VILLLAGVNVVLRFGPAGNGPVGIGLVTGPTLAIALLVLARRAGLTWDELGLARSTWRRAPCMRLPCSGSWRPPSPRASFFPPPSLLASIGLHWAVNGLGLVLLTLLL